MGKLSSYTTVTTYGTGDYLSLHVSGVSNSRITPSSLFGTYFGFAGNSGKAFYTNGVSGLWQTVTATAAPGGSSGSIQYNNGTTLDGNSIFVYSGGNVGINTSSPQARLHVSGRAYIDRHGVEDFTDSNNTFLSISNYYSNTGVNYGEIGFGVDTTGNPHIQTYNGKHLIVNQYGGRVGFFAHPNTNFYATFAQNVGPSSDNTVNLGSASYRWGSGFFNFGEFYNLNVSGGTTGIFPSEAGNSGKILATDGTTRLWVASGAGGGGTPAGSNTYVQWNSGGAFGADSGFIYSGGAVGIGAAFVPSSVLHILPTGSSAIPFIVQAAVGQTANLTQWRNSAGTTRSHVNSSGFFFLPMVGAAITNSGSGVTFGSGANSVSIYGSNDTFDCGMHFTVGNLDFLSLYKWGTTRVLQLSNSVTAINIAGGNVASVGSYGPDKPTNSTYGNIARWQMGSHSSSVAANSVLDIGGALTLTQVTTAGAAHRPCAIFEPFWNNSADAGRCGAATIGVYSAASGLQVAARFNAISGGTSGDLSTVIYNNLIVSGSSAFTAKLNISGVTTASGNILSANSGGFNIGAIATPFNSGFYRANYADQYIVNSGISGAAYTWPIVYGWSFPSGVASGTGVNVSYEIPVILPCVLGSGGYCKIRSKTTGSGHVSGFMVDINVDGVSIWSTTQSNRLAMANNTRSGQQTVFDYTGVIGINSYFSLDFDFVPTGTYANDIVIEILTMAQK